MLWSPTRPVRRIADLSPISLFFSRYSSYRLACLSPTHRLTCLDMLLIPSFASHPFAFTSSLFLSLFLHLFRSHRHCQKKHRHHGSPPHRPPKPIIHHRCQPRSPLPSKPPCIAIATTTIIATAILPTTAVFVATALIAIPPTSQSLPPKVSPPHNRKYCRRSSSHHAQHSMTIPLLRTIIATTTTKSIASINRMYYHHRWCRHGHRRRRHTATNTTPSESYRHRAAPLSTTTTIKSIASTIE